MSRLNDRYLMESTMTNKDYLRDKKAIEIEYLKTNLIQMIDSGYPKLVFDKNDFTVTTTGDGTIRTWTGNYEEDTGLNMKSFLVWMKKNI